MGCLRGVGFGFLGALVFYLYEKRVLEFFK